MVDDLSARNCGRISPSIFSNHNNSDIYVTLEFPFSLDRPDRVQIDYIFYMYNLIEIQAKQWHFVRMALNEISSKSFIFYIKLLFQ